MTEKTKSYHHGNLREELLNISVTILQDEGVDAITMREIARRIGVSHSAAYRHFKDKDTLLSAIAQQGYEELTQRLREVYDTDDVPAAERFRQIGITYVVHAVTNPARYRLMYGSDAVDRNTNPELRKAARQLAREVLRMIHLCQQQGSLRQENTAQVANAVWSLCHGAAMLVIDGHIRVEDVPAFADQMTAYLDEGISHR
jgi:AcrR family transcriptional regulator